MTSGYLTPRDLDSVTAENLAAEIRANVRGRCLVNEPLARHTSWRVGGPARLYVYPADRQALGNLLSLCREKSLRTFIIGYGTNLLVSDDGFAGCVIDLADGFRESLVEGTLIRASSGAWAGDVVRMAAEAGLAGMEKLAGIPGGLGGLIWMNGGAFGAAISDHLLDIDIMEMNGEFRTISKDEAGFIYRAAPGLVGKVILSARFELESRPRDQVVAAVEETIAERYRRNVMTLPSAGSVFKNPPGHHAAKLIEAVGAKGMTEGGVEVSPLHTNFIVNTRGGCAGDIVRLISRIRKMVQAKFEINLELEVRTLGFDNITDYEAHF